MSGHPFAYLFTMAVLAGSMAWPADVPPVLDRRSALPGDTPDGSILRVDLDGGTRDWLPNCHDGDFLKAHVPPGAIQDPPLNWENPFSFFDLAGDGVSEMALRWCVPRTIQANGSVVVADRASETFVTFDLDHDSGQGNEVVRYTDTDRNGFIDRIEFDHDGDRTIDLTVDRLAWKTAGNPHPDFAGILETRTLGWKGLHEQFTACASHLVRIPRR